MEIYALNGACTHLYAPLAVFSIAFSMQIHIHCYYKKYRLCKEVLLTGDKDFLESGLKNPIIITPAEFLNME